MPSKNSVKQYYENAYYHVYNRGVEKRIIFLDDQDCKVFLRYLKLYLSPISEIETDVKRGVISFRFLKLNLFDQVDLISFCLMPNHFHLLLKQHSQNGITTLLKRLTTGYVMYFNRKYDRVGPLFQGIFKACSIESDQYLIHLTRYIHLNSLNFKGTINFSSYSSYSYYRDFKKASWVKPQEILAHFKESPPNDYFSYQSFVENYKQDPKEMLKLLVLEESCF